MSQRTLIGIGGGGATHGTHPGLDRLCLEYARERPRIGYVGAASGDGPEKYRGFCDGFEPYAAAITRLSSESNRKQATIWVDDLDLIYVGGGSPVSLVDHWNATGIGSVLIDAFRRGVTLAGVSAGAMCWFENFLWRSAEDGLRVAEGLGLVKGTMTPHSLTEPDRRASMKSLVSSGVIRDGYAVDDGAALVLQEGKRARAYPTEGPPFVHRIRRKNGETVLNP